MNKYALFAGSNYYPNGGWEDYIRSFPTLEDAKLSKHITDNDWAQIVDLEYRSIVWEK